MKNLLARYMKLKVEGHSRIPLVINTMGWVKGMGLDLLNQIIAMSRPEHILQIVGNSEKKRFSLTLPEFLRVKSEEDGKPNNAGSNSSSPIASKSNRKEIWKRLLSQVCVTLEKNPACLIYRHLQQGAS